MRGGGKWGFVMGSRTQECPGNIREKKIYGVLNQSELGNGTQGAGPLRAVLHSNSFAANLLHGHLTYL